ncbi:MAG: hypothetical protein IPM16_23755 [Chloroflexi bacterium]|nr:hypothetical protein [Chloroflexota bacterium]
MTDIQAQLAIQITPDEYELLIALRTLAADDRTRILEAVNLAREAAAGTSGKDFVRDLDALRSTMNDEQLQRFKESLADSDPRVVD